MGERKRDPRCHVSIHGPYLGTFTIHSRHFSFPDLGSRMWIFHRILYPNALNRFALGTKTRHAEVQRRRRPDHLSGEPIARQREGIQLATAPAGNFSIWIRAYWPDQAILDGIWNPKTVRIRQLPTTDREKTSPTYC